MRTRGEGTIQKLPGSKFRGMVRIEGKPFVGPTVLKRADALPAMWAKWKAKQKSPPEEPTLSTCVRLKIAAMASGSYSPTTVDLWRAFNKRIEGDAIGELRPSEIEDMHAAAWKTRQSGGNRTVKNYLVLLRQILREYGRIVKVELPSTRERKIRLLSPEEQTFLLNMKMGPDVRTMVLLALRMGLRRSEIAGLRHEDREGEGVNICRAVVRMKGAIAIKGTKTASSEAWIPLCDELLPVIGHGQGYVFGGDVPKSPSVLDDRWRRLIRGTSLEGVGLHDLRRSFGMRLLESGVDVRTAAEMLRHDVGMLLRLYTKSRRDLKVAAARKLGAG